MVNCYGVAVLLLSFGIHAESDELVALGCSPESKSAVEPNNAAAYRTAPRERYVFMRREADGEISMLCVDELGTDEVEPVTCESGDDLLSGASEVSASWFAGFRKLTIFRADASMRTDLLGSTSYNYSCAPSRDPQKVFDYVSQEKQKQKTANVF